MEENNEINNNTNDNSDKLPIDVKGLSNAYQQYGYYNELYVSECIYSMIADLTGNLIEVDNNDWITDKPPSFNISSAIVGKPGTGKSTTIRKFKTQIYNNVISQLTKEFSPVEVEELKARDLRVFMSSGEGLSRELDGIDEKVIRVIGIQFSKTMSKMFGDSYLAFLPEIFMALFDGDEIDRQLSSGNIHIDGGKFTTIMLDIHPDDLKNEDFVNSGFGRRTNLAIYTGGFQIPEMTVETSQKNTNELHKIENDFVNKLVERIKMFIRVDNDPKPKICFDREAKQILLNIIHKYGIESEIAMERYPTITSYAILEAILNSPIRENTLTVDKGCIGRALLHLSQYKEEQEKISQNIHNSELNGRVESMVNYVNKNSYVINGEIKWVKHADIMRKLVLNSRQIKEAEIEVSQSRRCWVISYKFPKRKPSKILARGDIDEKIVRSYLDSEAEKNKWEKYEIEGDE